MIAYAPNFTLPCNKGKIIAKINSVTKMEELSYFWGVFKNVLQSVEWGFQLWIGEGTYCTLEKK